MKTIRVNFESVVPQNASDSEVEEWVEYNLYKTSISTKNPLVNVELEAARHSVIIRNH